MTPSITRRARACGRAAARALAAHGRVLAAFEHSVYVETPTGLACLGEIDGGPLNLSLDGPPPRLIAGDAVARDGSTLRVGRSLTVLLAESAPWRPPPVPPWDGARVRDGLAAIASLGAPRDGLAPLLAPLAGQRHALPAFDDPLLARAGPAMAHLAAWAAAPDNDASFLAPLAGLGPGLTPSGDDAVGGAMIAARAFGFAAEADTIAAAVTGWPESATGSISRAHLRAAAEGEGMAALHDALAAVASADGVRVAAACRALGAIGHSSGWDALVGVVAMLTGLAARPDAMA